MSDKEKNNEVTIKDRAPATSSGNWAPATSSGYGAPATSSGDSAPATSSGNWAPATSSGYGAIARAGNDGFFILLEYDDNGEPIAWRFGIVGVDGIKAHTWYEAKDGGVVEVAGDDNRVVSYYELTKTEPPKEEIKEVEVDGISNEVSVKINGEVWVRAGRDEG